MVTFIDFESRLRAAFPNDCGQRLELGEAGSQHRAHVPPLLGCESRCRCQMERLEELPELEKRANAPEEAIEPRLEDAIRSTD
jgi:hypothetical protein